MIDPNQRLAYGIWRDKGVSTGCGHPIDDGQRLPSADHKGCNIPSRWLLICI